MLAQLRSLILDCSVTKRQSWRLQSFRTNRVLYTLSEENDGWC